MDRPATPLYEFGRYVLDPAEQMLLREGHPVPLRPKVFDTLLFLVERHGHLVAKDELMRTIWPDQIVDDGNLNKTMSLLRQALGDSPTAYIETVARRGYRFVAGVRIVPRIENRDERPLPRRRNAVMYVVTPADIITLATAAWVSSSGRGRTAASLAVMPFITDANDEQAHYLSEGITETLITTLSQPGDLKVMSRNSVFRFRGQSVDARDAAKQLQVRAVLVGDLQRVNGQVAINVELIEGGDGSVMWTQRYGGNADDLIDLHTRAAHDIAANVRLKLTGSDQRQLTRRHTHHREAYELYLKGRYLWNRNKRTREELRKSRESFQQAIDLDPNFALAYVGLAESYNMQVLYSEVPSTESVPLAKAAAMKALQLDETLSEAHTALGWLRFAYERDFAGAEASLRRAIELNPNNALAQNYYGALLAILGRFDEAVARKKAALELDPFSPPMRASAGWILYFARRYDEAIEQCLEVLAVEEDFHRAHLYMALAYQQKGLHEEAIAKLQRALALAGGSVDTWAAMAHAYAQSGRKLEAQKIVDQLIEWSTQRYVDPYPVAIAYAGLGDNDRAFAWLEKALESRSIMLVWLNVEPRLDSIRTDPRYPDLVRRVGLPL